MNNESSKSEKRNRKLRLKFSIRTLLIVFSVVAISICWVGDRVRKSRNEQAVLAGWIKLNANCKVQYSHQYHNGKWTGEKTPPGPMLLRQWLGEYTFAEIYWLSIVPHSFETLDVEGLRGIETLSSLKRLTLFRLNLKSLKEIGRLKDLEFLNLAGLESLDDLSDLQELQQLKELRLARTESLHDISVLLELPNIENLDIRFAETHGEHVETRKGYFETITKLKSLKKLYVFDRGLTQSFDLRRLSELSELEQLCLSNVESLTDLSVLQSFPKLERLILRGPIRNLDGLAHLSRLKEVHIHAQGHLKDASGISKLKSVEKIIVTGHRLENLDAFAGLQNLKDSKITRSDY